MVRMNPEEDMRREAPSSSKVFQPIAPRTVVAVMVTFKYPRDLCAHDAAGILREFRGWPVQATMHGDRQIAYIVQTHLTPPQLRAYLAEPLSVGSVQAAHLFTPGADVVSTNAIDQFEEVVTKAWAGVRQYNERHRFRRPPQEFLERTEPMSDGTRGTITRRVLDDHPLAQRRTGNAR